jgi:ribose transport system permease protein
MKDTAKKVLAQAGPFLGLAVVIALFAFIVPPDSDGKQIFFDYHNFKTIFTQTVIVAIGALGMTMIIVSGGIDLSVGSSIAFTSVVGALLVKAGAGPVGALLGTIACGAVIGLLNGAAIAGLRVTPFIITLGTLGVWRGSAKLLARNQTVNYDFKSPIDSWMRTEDPFSYAMPVGVWVALALAFVTALVLRNTVFGRHVFALGSNESTARLCGIATSRLKVLIYTIAGGFFGLAGIFQMSRISQGDPTAAVGLELDIIAAVIIGGASLNGGVGTILGSMIGALTMAVLRNGSQLAGWETPVQEIIIGVVIIVAVFVDRLRQGKQA